MSNTARKHCRANMTLHCCLVAPKAWGIIMCLPYDRVHARLLLKTTCWPDLLFSPAAAAAAAAAAELEALTDEPRGQSWRRR